MPIFEFTLPAFIYVILPLMALGAFYIILFNQKKLGDKKNLKHNRNLLINIWKKIFIYSIPWFLFLFLAYFLIPGPDFSPKVPSNISIIDLFILWATGAVVLSAPFQ